MGTKLTLLQKKELSSLLFRSLNNQQDFSWKELESICFNMKYFEECVTKGDWFRAEEYISAFIEPETDDDGHVMKIFFLLQNNRDNVDKLDDKTLDIGNMLKVLRELIEVVRQRVLSKLRSYDGLAGVPDIPLRSLVDALSSHGCKRTSDEGHQVERHLLEPTGDKGTRQFSGEGPSLSTQRPCGACKVTRDRCDHLCEFYPYFPRRDTENFIAVREVFGKKKVIDLLKVVPQESKASTISNLISEAKIRRRDPVGGCMAVIASLQAKLNAERVHSISGHQVERHLLEPTGDKGTRQFWRAMAGEPDVMQEAYKVEEANAAADRAMDLATRKRERAQMLLQNSELATYKAVMAVHIAEAAEAVGSTEDVADLLLDRD